MTYRWPLKGVASDAQLIGVKCQRLEEQMPAGPRRRHQNHSLSPHKDKVTHEHTHILLHTYTPTIVLDCQALTI